MDTKSAEPLLAPPSSRQATPQTSPSSTLNRAVRFVQGDLSDSYESDEKDIRSICILDSTPSLSKLFMVTPLLLVVAGLSLVTISEYGSYGESDPNDDRVTVIGKLVFAGSSIFIAIVSVILVTPDPFYVSAILIIFSNISVPFSWLFSVLSLLELIIIAVIYKTIRHNLKTYKLLISGEKSK